MEQFNRYFAIFVSLLFFAFGAYILVSPTFSYLSKEMRVIFAVFLFLYGLVRISRSFFRKRDKDNS
jgi:hypothetical protein